MPLPPNSYLANAFVPTDDWEAAYDRDEDSATAAEKNARLWSNANTTAPTYTVLSSSSSSSAARPPPSAALNEATTNGPPRLQILKRPTASPSPSSNASRRTPSATGAGAGGGGGGGLVGEKSYTEREKLYAEARRRILGEEEAGKGGGAPVGGLSKLSITTPLTQGRSGGRRSDPRTASPAVPSSSSSSASSSAKNSRARTPRPSTPKISAPPPPGSSATRAPKGRSQESGGFGFEGGGTSRERGQKAGRGR